MLANASRRMVKNLFYYMIQYFSSSSYIHGECNNRQVFFFSSSAAQIKIAEDRK